MRLTSIGSGTRAHLIDVQTSAGAQYYWADQPVRATPLIGADDVDYDAWMLVPPAFKRTRSLATDSGSFTLQNLSGDTLARDFERILRRSAMEGAIFAYRFYNVAAQVADLTFYGRLSVGDVGVSTATLNCAQLLDGSADTPGMTLSESCQLDWAKSRCGADPSGTECKYSLQTCQVPERLVAITNTYYDKNYSEAIGSVPVNVVNRRRRI